MPAIATKSNCIYSPISENPSGHYPVKCVNVFIEGLAFLKLNPFFKSS